ncbi:hypothetical protein JTB14_001371 [Gonioctena quinquepunctata]|nr:hypothetical protein JTB14_001371 [Gonioctena quinquepunctata]
MGLKLNSYNFNVIYQPEKENYPADSLSRLPLQETSEQSELPNHAKLLHMRVRNLPMKRSHLKRETMNDSTLSNVIRCLQTYWPEKKNLHRDLVPFYEKRTELSFEEDLLLWKGRTSRLPIRSTGICQMNSPQLHQSASCNENESSLNEVEAEEGELNNVDHSLSRECIIPRRNPFRIRKPPSRFLE